MKIETILQADLLLQKKKLDDLKKWNGPAALIEDQEALISALEQSSKALLDDIEKAPE